MTTNRTWIVAGLVVAAFWIVAFVTRLVPLTYVDRGIFMSVAERMLAGDRLYADVYDNKDPLFYYLVAAERAAGPIAEYLAELLMVMIAAVSAAVTARSVGLPREAAAFVGFVGSPMVVTGGTYDPGATHMPGIALFLVSVALMTTRRPLAAGGAIGVLFFTKLVMMPAAAAFAVVFVLIGFKDGRRPQALVAGVAGFLVASAVVLAVLALRGELVPWLDAQISNILYSQGALVRGTDGVDTLVNHVRTVLSYGPLAIAATILAALVAAVVLVVDPAVGGGRAFLGATLVAFVTALAVTVVTTIWPHHLQLLFPVAVLLLIPIAALVFATMRTLPAVVLSVLAALLLSGTFDPRIYVVNPLSVGIRLADLAVEPQEAAALRAVAGGPTAYARLGQNDDRGHTAGLRDFELACPSIQQYPFYSVEELAQIRACAATAPYLIVAATTTRLPQLPVWYPPYADGTDLLPVWNDHVAAVEAMLAKDYDCTPFGGGGRICKRRTAP